MNLGTIVVDEVICPVIAVYLSGGKLCVTASRGGPLSVDLRDSEARVHDPDGNLVCTTVIRECGKVRIADGARLDLTLELNVVGKATEGWHRRQELRRLS